MSQENDSVYKGKPYKNESSVLGAKINDASVDAMCKKFLNSRRKRILNFWNLGISYVSF